MLVEFGQNRMVQTAQNFELFDKKNGFFISIFDNELTFLQLKLLFNAKLLFKDYHLFSVPKITVLRYLQPD